MVEQSYCIGYIDWLYLGDTGRPAGPVAGFFLHVEGWFTAQSVFRDPSQISYPLEIEYRPLRLYRFVCSLCPNTCSWGNDQHWYPACFCYGLRRGTHIA
ncbi:MAG: hypothetical protein JWQ57_530 [Mucilaginibacter sp.]|nr:hypothetical protein [Mucilaginibacter sp.]